MCLNSLLNVFITIFTLEKDFHGKVLFIYLFFGIMNIIIVFLQKK